MQEYESLLQLAKKRKAKLEDARNFHQFQVDMKEEEAWVIERQRICQTGVTAKDLRSVMALQQKHKVSNKINNETRNVYFIYYRITIFT